MMSRNEVTHAGGAISPTGTLAQIRDTLKDAGFTQQELVCPAKPHNGARYCPTWGEV